MKACKPRQTLSETHPHPHYEPIDDPQQKSKQNPQNRNPQNLNPKEKTHPEIHLKIKPIANSNPKPIKTHPPLPRPTNPSPPQQHKRIILEPTIKSEKGTRDDTIKRRRQ